MSNVTVDTGASSPKQKDLTVQVRYIAVKQPVVDKFEPTMTLTDFKVLVLNEFGLREGPADGGTKVYNLVFNSKTLTDLSVALGTFGEHELKFTLVEQLIQG